VRSLTRSLSALSLFASLSFSPVASAAAPLHRPVIDVAPLPTLRPKIAAKLLVRSRQIKLDVNALRAAAAKPASANDAPRVELQLFNDVKVTAIAQDSETDHPGKFAFAGPLESGVGEAVVISHGGNVLANVRANGKLFQIRPGENGVHFVLEVNEKAFPQEGEPTAAATRVFNPLKKIRQIFRAGQVTEGDPSGDTDDGSVIDVMLAYTKATADASSDIEGEMQLAMYETNLSYKNSGIKQRVKLVHAVEVNYAETGDTVLDRNRLRIKNDGFLDNLHALRDEYRADVVALWTETGDWCGYAYIMGTVNASFEDHAFSVTQRSCALSKYSFAHEMGHNMGARHDRYVDNTDDSPYKYNHCITHPGTATTGWRTMMAYGDACDDAGKSCPRIAYWSNPDKTYNGVAMGVASGSKQADNRKTLNNTALTVANFRLKGNLGLNEAGDRVGASLARGDFDGDGYQDLAIGAPGEAPGSSPKSGAVFLYKGMDNGLKPWAVLTQSTLGMNEAGDEFGASLASGDFNADGYEDLAIGSPGEIPHGSTGAKSGYVFVFKGTLTGLRPWKGLDQAGLETNEAGDRFGHAVASGDFNGDGKADLAVGAPHDGVAAGPKGGAVYTFKGGSAGPTAWKRIDQVGLDTNEASDFFGWSLAVGDFDGDRKGDLAVGAWNEDGVGAAYTFRGATTGVAAWKKINQAGLGAEEGGDQFGLSLAAGDVNGDGKADLAVGAPGEIPGGSTGPRSGYVFLFKGATTGVAAWQGIDQSLGSPEEGDRFGGALAMGDFNGDGKHDLAVGSLGEQPPGETIRSGWVFLYKGAAAGVTGWQSLGQAGLGVNEAGDQFGSALVTGDFNGDGKSDLAVGAPGESPGADPQSGYGFVFKGSSAGVSASQGLHQEM
jgi:hypothetical protein